jgi:prepilin-type N-terminal cleavage/methylation domain-containing protein
MDPGVLMRDTRGFTLIEVIIAMVILMSVIAAMATATGGFVRSVAEDDVRAAAVQLADDRIQAIEMDPNYAGFGAYAVTENAFPTLPGFTRTTTVNRITANSQDHTVITVVVNGPGLLRPVERTTTVAPTTGAQ